MTREQLISLLYSILRRLLLMPQTLAAPTDGVPRGQGFQPTAQGDSGSIDNLHIRPTLLRTPGASSHAPADMIFASPPCTAFSRPWQPGYTTPVIPSPSVGGASSRDADDPWAAPAEPPVMAADQFPQSDTATLPLNSLLMPDNRPVCTQFCNCPAQCVLTKAGHTRHLCGACIYRRRRGDPRSGS